MVISIIGSRLIVSLYFDKLNQLNYLKNKKADAEKNCVSRIFLKIMSTHFYYEHTFFFSQEKLLIRVTITTLTDLAFIPLGFSNVFECLQGHKLIFNYNK